MSFSFGKHDLNEDIVAGKYLSRLFLIEINAYAVVEEKHSADKNVYLVGIKLRSGISYGSKNTTDVSVLSEHSCLNKR